MRAQSGQATEYVLTAVLISLGLLLVVFRFGGALRGRFDHAAQKLETASPGSGIRTGGGQEKEGSASAPQESGATAASQDEPGAGGAAANPGALNFSISWGTAIWILALVAVMAMLYLTRMQKAIRKTQAKEKALREREARLKSENGQAMLEFFFASLVGIVLILGIFQITLIYNARSLVKLAAFNAARAAIVARADSSPTSEDPVDLDLMRTRAKRAAFLTILPVIPGIQGRLDPDQQKRPAAAKNLLVLAKALQTLAWTAGPIPPSPATDLAVLGGVFGFSRAAVALYESIGVTIDDDLNLVDCLDVQFVDPKADLDDDKAIKKAIIKKWPKKIAFDDPKEHSDDNLIKVLVTWRYPLVIPFANRIITATARPKLYAIALGLEGSSATVDDMQKKLPQMNKMIPVWATGFAFSQVGFATFGLSGVAGTLAPIFSGVTVIPPQYQTPGEAPPPGMEGIGETVFTQKSGENSIRQSLGEFLIFRVPVRATYIMRMQWDRKG